MRGKIAILLTLFIACAPALDEPAPDAPADKSAGVILAPGEYASCLMAGLFVCKKTEPGRDFCVATGLSCNAPRPPQRGTCECMGKCNDCIWTPQEKRFFVASDSTCDGATEKARATTCADCTEIKADICWQF